ncbi:MAG: amino acid ABC transporter substrate-binding protein [Chitinophagales bacterium]|nr:amino acid ABC transporter substrate-binding protein [Hyphomicrobiales bacterium]
MRANLFAGLVATAVAVTAAQAGPTLDAVKSRGVLKCGVAGDAPGFSAPNAKGEMTGLDASVCRAVAAAVLGDSSKVQFVPTNTQTRFPTLQSGEIDMLARTATMTFTRDTTLGLLFGPPVFYDGQGLMVAKKLGVKSAKELNGATVCVSPGTTSELNLADYFRANKMQFKPVVIESLDQVRTTFFSGRCDVMTDDRSTLASNRTVASNPDDYVILSETISKEPLAPVVRQGDDQWFTILRWVVFALITAEEQGVTKANVDEKRQSGAPDVQFFLGKDEQSAKGLGLKADWAYQAVKQAGNYGEIYAQSVGEASPLKLPRNLNELWTNGGLMYAPPIR